MNYRFKYQIVDEDDNVAISGSTYLTHIDQFGQCESVELETGSALRAFNTYLKVQERIKEEAEELLEEKV